jgi:hypothetical protein
MIIAFASAKEFVALKAFPAVVFIPFARPSILRITALLAPPLAFHGMVGVLVVSSFAAGTIFPVLEEMGLLPNSIKVLMMIEKVYWHIIVVGSVANQRFVVAKFSKNQAFEDVSSMVFVVKHFDHWAEKRVRIILIQVQWDSGVCHQLDGIISHISQHHSVTCHVCAKVITGEFSNVMHNGGLDCLE